MGGLGSGPQSVKARAFDLYEFGLTMLTYLKFHLQDPETRPFTEELFQEWADALDGIDKKLKRAIEEERNGANGKHG